MADPAKPGATPQPVESHVREHGVWGYDANAVGGFGEDYDAQVARGSAPSLPDATPEEAELAQAVQKNLARAHVDAADLRVDVHDGVVTLYGSVRQEFEKGQLESRARAVAGVASVTSKLTVASGLVSPG